MGLKKKLLRGKKGKEKKERKKEKKERERNKERKKDRKTERKKYSGCPKVREIVPLTLRNCAGTDLSQLFFFEYSHRK